MSRRGKFYLTTAIFYPNAEPHVGSALEIVGADVQARYRRLVGHDVFFLTGTDEHGQKIPQKAAKLGIHPRELVDRHVPQFQDLFSRLLVTNDDFIRTSQERHHQGVRKLWQDVAAAGHIYAGSYEGWYNTREEAYISETEMKERGFSTDDPLIRWMKEESYFFRLSSFQQQIERLFEERPEFCQPEFRAREMLGSFVRPGLEDLCISRSSIDWGIPVPDAPGHVVYVWFDALTNYLTGIGYGEGEDWRRWWPADCHVIGKDILKFHTIIWPAMLMAGGVELPRQVFGHGFITVKKEKMSKSLGNIVDPLPWIDFCGPETLRYYLVRESNFANDGDFDPDNLVARHNDDLSNGIGNLLSRSLTLIEKNLGGRVPASPGDDHGAAEIRNLFAAIVEDYERMMPSFEFASALGRIWEGQTALDRYINDRKPWALAKDPARREELAAVLYVVAEGLRLLATLISPVLPLKAQEIWRRLGMERELLSVDWDDHRRWGLLPEGARVEKGEPLFPRLELKPAE